MRQGASASSRVPRDRAAFGLPRSPLHILLVQNLIDNYFFINEKINISWLVRLHNKGRRARSDCWWRTGYSCGWRWRGWAFQTPPQDKLNFTTQKKRARPLPGALDRIKRFTCSDRAGPQTVSRARYQVADVLAFARRCKEQPPAGHRAPALTTSIASIPSLFRAWPPAQDSNQGAILPGLRADDDQMGIAIAFEPPRRSNDCVGSSIKFDGA